MPNPTISQLRLPSGNVYDIKDSYARQLLAGGLQFIVCYDGTAAPVVANIPSGVTVKYNNTNYVGTKEASTAEALAFYLVKETNNVYSEYVSIKRGSSEPYTYLWEKLGDTSLDLSNLGNLAYKSNVTLNKGNGDNVLGESTTFTNGTSTVSFTSHTTDKVLGSDATFTTTVTPTTTNIKATATGTAVSTTASDSFVKSYPGTTSKLVTTSVPNVTAVGSASTWSFAMGSGSDSETLIISGANSTAPTLGTAITCATGSLNGSGGGATVMTGLGTATTGTAVGSVSVSTQPTIALSTGATAGTGVISVATGITSASTSTNNKDEVTAITALGTGTAAAQTITVGANDKIKIAKYDDLSVSVS